MSIKMTSGSVIVSWSFFGEKENDILLVGKKEPNESVKVINAFQGEEAHELYLKLTTPKENRNG